MYCCVFIVIALDLQMWLCFVKVGVLEDFNTEPQPLHSEVIDLKMSSSSGNSQQDRDSFFFPIFFFSRKFRSGVTSNKEAFEASKKTVNDWNNAQKLSNIVVWTGSATKLIYPPKGRPTYISSSACHVFNIFNSLPYH